MKKILFLLLPLILGFSFSEIMYDPEGTDNDKEWIEIINEELISLENYTISDNTSTDTLKLVTFRNSTINLIVEDNFTQDNSTANIYTIGSTIGNGLNNDKDTITLKDTNGTIIITTFYNTSMGGKNGRTLCWNNNWTDCEATPGYRPAVSTPIIHEINTTNETILNQTTTITNTTNQTLPTLNTTINQTDQTTTLMLSTLYITEIMPNPKGNDRANYPGGEWVEVYNYGEQTINLEGITIKDKDNHYVTLGTTNIINGPTVPPKNYKVLALNGWSILNNGGDTVRLIMNNQTINETTYGSIEEDYTWSLTNNIWQRTQPTPEEENTQKKVETPIIESGLLIIKSPTQTSYGKTINITINITSTNEKELVTLAIPNITSTSITTYQPYTTLTLTLHLPENCEQQQAEGTHELSLNTNETITKKDILITHNKNCKKTTQSITTASAAKNNKTTYNISSIETLIKQEEKTSYQGTNNKLYTTSVYLFSILSLITIIYYWKKHGH